MVSSKGSYLSIGEFRLNITYVLTAFTGAAISLTVAVYLGRQSVVVAGKTVAILLAAASVWLLFVGLHETSSDIDTKVLLTKFQYLGTVIVPPAMLAAVLQYSGLGYLVTARNVILLMIVPLITLLLVWTFPLHELYWQEVVWRPAPDDNILDYRRGPLFWVWIAYAYLSLLIGTVLLIYYLRGTSSVFRGQYFVLFIAIIGPWISNVAYLLDLSPWPGIDTTAFGFLVTGLALSWGVLRLQMSNVIPLARRSILESMTDAIFVMDAQGKLVDLNPAAQRTVGSYIQRDPETLIGDPAAEAFDALPALSLEVQRAIGQPSYQRNTEINLGTDQISDFQNLRLSPVIDPAGSFLGTLIELRDMNSLRQAEVDRLNLESELRQARKLESLGVMAGGVAHDFNNLLTGILGHAELAERKLPDDSTAIPHLKKVQDISGLAAELCDHLLAYSGKGQLDMRVLSINDIIRDVVSLSAISGTKSVQISFSVDDALPMVSADATQMRRLLLNLVINATEAIGEATGNITLSSERRSLSETDISSLDVGARLPAGDYVVLTVSDTGVGMDAATIERIFDPFFTTKFTGRGLGLSAALGIIQGHKGGLMIESQPGSGTTFQIFLPALDEALHAFASTTSDFASQAHTPSASTGKILVIDDELFVRDVAEEALHQLGFETLTASNGLEGVNVFTAHKGEIIAILLDLSMPEMDGEAFYQRLQKLDAAMPVIIMSGFHEKDVSLRFDQRDKLLFMQKPFNIARLQEVVQSVLQDD